MKLRIKVLVIMASIWATISAATYLYSKHVLVNEYARLEQQFVIDDIKQATNTLYSIMSSVKLLNTDWANWNDAYRFMKEKNESFIKSNMQTTTFRNAKISQILFFKPDGGLYYGRSYNKEHDALQPVNPTFLKKLQSQKNLINPPPEGTQGFMRSDNGYLVISSLPILTSEGKGPTAGTLIMAYHFDDQQLLQLADIINMQVKFFTVPIGINNTLLNDAHRQFLNGAKRVVASDNKDSIYGFAPIHNIQNQLIGILRISSPRNLYNAGINTIEQYLSIILMIGIVFMGTMWWLLERFVIRRIVETSNQIAEINQKGAFDQSIKINGNDELSSMIAGFNHLLEIISLAHEQLQRRVSLRTEELKRLSELNRDLFNEMNEQKHLESQLREQEKILRQMAYYDTLTGLPNKMYFQELLEKNIQHSQRSGASFAVLFLDADDFKRINDTYGHDTGDKYLEEVSKVLKGCIKDCDVAARIGGDEFIILLSGIKARALIQKATENILRAISDPMHVNNLELSSEFSVGISIYPEDGETADELEKHADFAMYYAKRQTNQAYAFYEDVKHSTFTTSTQTTEETETAEEIS